MYLTTRLDLMFSVNLLSRFIEKPTELHLNVVKKILRYLKGTINLGVHHRKKQDGQMIGFTDTDYVDDKKSTS